MMITSNGKQLDEMKYKELKAERRLQKWFAYEIKRLGDKEEYKHNRDLKAFNEEEMVAKIEKDFEDGKINLRTKTNRLMNVRKKKQAIYDKQLHAFFCRILEEATRCFILDIEEIMGRRKPVHKKKGWIKPRYTPYRWQHPRYRHEPTKVDVLIKKRNNEILHVEERIEKQGVVLQWDKRKFMLVARDRGYMSEEATAYAVEQELGVPKVTSKKMVNNGKFTWGQVLVVGALFEMTPKEFCDIFLNGFFVDVGGGDYRASCSFIDKEKLLGKQAMRIKREREKERTK